MISLVELWRGFLLVLVGVLMGLCATVFGPVASAAAAAHFPSTSTPCYANECFHGDVSSGAVATAGSVTSSSRQTGDGVKPQRLARTLSTSDAPRVAANAGVQGSRATLAEVNALVPEGQTLGTWGSQIWGRGADGAKSLIGSRGADELAQIPGLNVQSATVPRNFYQDAVDAGKGGATAPIRVQLLDDIIKRMGG